MEMADDDNEILLAARYGDLDDIREFVKKFGSEKLGEVRDENENNLLHMVCGNGHLDVLEYLLPLVTPSLLAAQNHAKSTPLHWAALNSHLSVVQRLVEYPGGPGIDLIDIKNSAGRTPLGEAELSEWEEGAAWLTRMMKLDATGAIQEVSGGVEGEGEGSGKTPDIEVEIENVDN